jgi:outer membrane protein assembly factor BamB
MTDVLLPAAPPSRPVLPRFWPAFVLVGLYWTSYLLPLWIEIPTFAGFLTRVASSLLLTLLFTAWWLLSRRVRLPYRLGIFGVAIAGGILATLLSYNTLGPVAWLMLSLPCVFTAWAAWLLISQWMPTRVRLLGLPAILVLTWAAFLPIRIDGLAGDTQYEFRWRWSPTAEERYLAKLANREGPALSSRGALTLSPGDWPGFRGPSRDGVVRGTRIGTDWDVKPPRLVWKQLVGPAWSSLAVVGDRLFTQEQRGHSEAVVCLDANTGRENWVHLNAVRFEEGIAGAGPRATPTFADGRIYALGATGILNCLDAASGERRWSRDIAAESGASLPKWGFTSSPLVVNGVVVVFAGGEELKGLLAYHAETGQPAWTAVAGKISYSSPQLATFDKTPQILFFSERGLTALDPATGALLWEHETAGRGPGLPRSLQPQPVGDAQIVLASEADLGTALLDLKRDGTAWAPAQRWASKAMKPSFNDFVVSDGFVYGFDGGTFCCVDLATGKQRWKRGKYGHGQVVLLAEQRLLLVAAENGEVVLLAADPAGHRELGQIQAVEGKTWNHPAVANGRLYVRNAAEMACYELPPEPSR